MKVVKTAYLLLLVSIIMTVGLVNFASTQSIPTLKVKPENTIASGDSFTVQLWVYGADNNEHTDVAAYQIFLDWDQTYLDMDDFIVWGTFMDEPRIGPWGSLTTDADAGQNIVNIADGSKYQPGYGIYLQDDSNSETNAVASVVGGQITLETNLANTYTVSANGGAYPIADSTPAVNINHVSGRVMAGQTTNGPAPGQNGDGWLCSFKFYVLSPAETTLNIDSLFSFIINDLDDVLGDTEGEVTKESGYVIFAWPEDLNTDGAIDIFDLSSVALHFAETGDPGWIPEDIVADGTINVIDLTEVAQKFGVYAGE